MHHGVITLELCDMGVITVKYFYRVIIYDSHCEDNNCDHSRDYSVISFLSLGDGCQNYVPYHILNVFFEHILSK